MEFIKDALTLPIVMFTKWFPQMHNACMRIFDEIPTLLKILGLLPVLAWAIPKFIRWFFTRD